MPIARAVGWPYSHPVNTQFTINRESPQARGLVGWFPVIGSNSVSLINRINGTPLQEVVTEDTHPHYIYDGEMGAVLENVNAAPVTHKLGTSDPSLRPSQFTISAWANATTGFDASDSFVSYGPSDNSAYGYMLYYNTAGDITRFYIGTGGWVNIESDNGNTVGEFYHYVGTYDGTNLVFYVNGRQQSGSASGTIDYGVSPSFCLWTYQSGVGIDCKTGDIRVYDRVLSAAEVYSSYAPNTRWDLYKPVISRFFSIPSVAAPAGARSRLAYSKWGKNA